MINSDYSQEKQYILCTVAKRGFTEGQRYTVQMQDKYVMGIYDNSGVLRRIKKEYFYNNFRDYPNEELIIK